MAGTLGIVIRFALYIDLMLLAGLPAFAIYTSATSGAWLRRPVAAAAIAGLILSVIGIAMMAASMSGVPLEHVDRTSVTMLITGTAAGTAWLVRIAALLAALAASVFAGGRLMAWGAGTAGCAALATLAWTGHGMTDDGRTGIVHLIADTAHLLAAGIWAGALAGMIMLLFRPASLIDSRHIGATHNALAAFAKTGTVAVGVIVATGVVNSWLLVGPGNLLSLGTTLYGQLLLAKLALFGAMLALAAANRFRLVPALERAIETGHPSAALQALRRSLAIETGCATLILALVAWLGTLTPPASM